MGELRVSTWCKTRQKSIRAMMILSENSTRLPERESSVHDIHLAPTRRRHNRQAAIRKSRSKGNRARHNRTLETLGSGRALPRERIENRKYRQRKTSSSAAKSGKRKATGPEGGEGTKRTSKNASAGSSDDVVPVSQVKEIPSGEQKHANGGEPNKNGPDYLMQSTATNTAQNTGDEESDALGAPGSQNKIKRKSLIQSDFGSSMDNSDGIYHEESGGGRPPKSDAKSSEGDRPAKKRSRPTERIHIADRSALGGSDINSEESKPAEDQSNGDGEVIGESDIKRMRRFRPANV